MKYPFSASFELLTVPVRVILPSTFYTVIVLEVPTVDVSFR